ncbi:MAG: glycoside hydrolase, partial [Planctomycetes bacterium]|nr:glycoside hydrolase [Planctomycetota bacterium]
MPEAQWSINENEYFETQGCSVLLYHNPSIYHQGGLEIIHHGERVAGGGDVHLEPADGRRPGRRDVGERQVDREAGEIAIPVRYANPEIGYTVRMRVEGASLRLRIDLDRPLNPQEVAEASFGLELYPPAYFGKTFHLGEKSGIFPREVNRKMIQGPEGALGPAPMATGSKLVIASEDPARWLEIEQVGGEVTLVDNRNGWYQGWFEVRGRVATDRAEGALEWVITPHLIPGWRREPVVCISQVGYHPEQVKRAVIELDPRSGEDLEGRLLRIDPASGIQKAYCGPTLEWGRFLCYRYRIFDFSEVRDPGVYVVEYGGRRSDPFRVDRDVFRHGVWQPTLETFLPIQMCHAKVMDKDRVWHGACHLDDALQAPVSHEHCDYYRQGLETETSYKPHQHIPHLNDGGWHDAADTDLAAGSQARTTLLLALAREEFGIDFDR